MLSAPPADPRITILGISKPFVTNFSGAEGRNYSYQWWNRKNRQRQRSAVHSTGSSRSEGLRDDTGSSQSISISLDPAPHTKANDLSHRTALPTSLPVIGAAAALLFLGITRTIGAIRRKRNASDLEARGMLDESRDQKDPYLEDVMERMGRVQYGDLSETQINEARLRRSRARRGKLPPNEEEIDIPANHPFAKREQISSDQEELMKQRMRVRRGLPLQDLRGTRGLPGMPIPQNQPQDQSPDD